jgi:hypothetical protein
VSLEKSSILGAKAQGKSFYPKAAERAKFSHEIMLNLLMRGNKVAKWLVKAIKTRVELDQM